MGADQGFRLVVFDDAGFDDGFDRARRALAWWHEQRLHTVWGPTSSLTGGGAIAMLEAELGSQLGGLALALPSGTSAIAEALRLLAGPAGRVGLGSGQWAGIDGIVADAGLHTAEPGNGNVLLRRWGEPACSSAIPVVVDAADCPPIRYGELAADPSWAAVAVSFGPGKAVDAGEGGALVMRSAALYARAVERTQHPLRRRLAGVSTARLEASLARIHPVAAVIAVHGLCSDEHPRPSAAPMP